MSKVTNVSVYDPDDSDGLAVHVTLTGVSSAEAAGFVAAIEDDAEITFDVGVPAEKPKATRTRKSKKPEADAEVSADADADEKPKARSSRRSAKADAAPAEEAEKPKATTRRRKAKGITDSDLTKAASEAGAIITPAIVMQILGEIVEDSTNVGDIEGEEDRQKFLDELAAEVAVVEAEEGEK